MKFQTFICDCDLILFGREIVINMGDMIKAVMKNFDSKSGVSSRLSFCPIGQKSSIFKAIMGNGKF